MTLRRLIETAIEKRDQRLAIRAADICWARLGLNYAQTYALVRHVSPRTSLPEWEGLLYEGDNEGGC